MRLSFQIEFDKTLDFETPKKSVVVGRSPNSDLVVSNDTVSRQHCRIEEVENGFLITDLGSSNGTFIDGTRLIPNIKTPYQSPSQLRLGKLDAALVKGQSATKIPLNKIISSQASDKGNFTATIRIGRIELDQPSITLELEKKIKVSGPKNPISEHFKSSDQTETNLKKPLIILIGIVVIVVAWLLGD